MIIRKISLKKVAGNGFQKLKAYKIKKIKKDESGDRIEKIEKKKSNLNFESKLKKKK